MKNKMFRYVVLCLIMLSASFLTAGTDKNEQTDTLFNTGLSLFTQGKYRLALEPFQTICDVSNSEYRKEEAQIFIAKIHLNLQQYLIAEQELKELLKTKPGSAYKTEIRITLADVLWKQKNKIECLTVLITASGETKEDSIRTRTMDYITELLGNFSEKEIQSTRLLYKGKQEDALFAYCLAKLALQKGDTEKAKNILYPSVVTSSNNPYRDFVVKLYQTLESDQYAASGDYVLGVMLPLSIKKNTDARLPSGDVLDGIKLAIDNYNAKGGHKIGLAIRNTERDSMVVDTIVKEFATIKELKAVIGPLYSDECKWAAKKLSVYKIPLFSPTATDENLTAQSPYFWQANPTFSVRGKVMAHYVFEEDKRRKMAILFSDEGFSAICAKSFAREFTALRGTIVYEEKYQLNSTDFSRITNKIKSQQNNLEGIFLPISDRNAVAALLAAFVQADITLPIYGDQDWFNAPGLETSSTLSSLLVFSSDYFIDFSDTAFTSLNEKFYKINGYDINRNVLYGYDTANLLVQTMEVQSSIPADGGLMKLMTFPGLHNDYSFRNGKVNSSLNFVRWQDGVYERITKFSLDTPDK